MRWTRTLIPTLKETPSDARPGVRVSDADLLGIPIRLNIGERGLKDGSVELKPRREAHAALVPLAQVVERVKQILTDT